MTHYRLRIEYMHMDTWEKIERREMCDLPQWVRPRVVSQKKKNKTCLSTGCRGSRFGIFLSFACDESVWIQIEKWCLNTTNGVTHVRGNETNVFKEESRCFSSTPGQLSSLPHVDIRVLLTQLSNFETFQPGKCVHVRLERTLCVRCDFTLDFKFKKCNF